MKGMIFTVVLACSAILAACSSAALREAMVSTQSPSLSPAEEPTDEISDGVYHKTTVEEAKQIMDEGNVTVVDVCATEKYATGHIPDSILVPVESIGDAKSVELPDMEAVLSVHYCIGIRSRRTSDRLVELGYKHAYDFGGTVD